MQMDIKLEVLLL